MNVIFFIKSHLVPHTAPLLQCGPLHPFPPFQEWGGSQIERTVALAPDARPPRGGLALLREFPPDHPLFDAARAGQLPNVSALGGQGPAAPAPNGNPASPAGGAR